MNLVIVGHVDHGKSTLLARLLLDTGALARGKLEAVQAYCDSRSKRLEYAYLLDALQEERTKGITVDGARVSFASPRREYKVFDAPGHTEFLKNMVTGAAGADAAILVLDAAEGLKENTRRHGQLLSFLKVGRLLVAINKMDRAGYSRDRFEELCAELTGFLGGLGVRPDRIVPVAAYEGDNLLKPSDTMPWYSGPTLLQALDELPEPESLERLPFRMPVQDVYPPAHQGGVSVWVGRVESGTLRLGDEVAFSPSGVRARVKRFPEPGAGSRQEASPGMSVALELAGPVAAGRGELMYRIGEREPAKSCLLQAELFWLGKSPFRSGASYLLKSGTCRTRVEVVEILSALDTATLDPISRDASTGVGAPAVLRCMLRLDQPIGVDVADGRTSAGRFVLVDDFDISGGGLVREILG